MAATLRQIVEALTAQASDLQALAPRGAPEVVAQQVLYQARLGGAAGALVAPASARLHELLGTAGAGDRLAVRTRWSGTRSRPRLRPGCGPVGCLDATPDGASVLFAGEDMALRHWRVGRGDTTADIVGRMAHHVASLVVVGATRQVVAGCHDGSVVAFLLDGTAVERLGEHSGYVTGVAADASGDVIVSVGDDGRVLRWLPGGEAVQLGDARAGGWRAVAVDPAGSRVATTNRRGDVWLWRAAGPSDGVLIGERTALGPSPVTLHALAFAPDGSAVYSAGQDGTVRRWPVSPGDGEGAAGLPGAKVGSHRAPIRALTVTPGGDHLVAGAPDGAVLAWGLRPATAIRLLGRHDRAVNDVAVDDGGNVTSAGGDGQLLRLALRQSSDETDAGAEVWALVPLPDGSGVVGCGPRGVHRWDLGDGAALPPTRAVGPVALRRLSMAPDGTQVLGVAFDGQLVTCRLDGSGAAPLPLRGAGAGGRLTDVAVLPDGRGFVTAGGDGRILRWDAGGGTSVLVGSHAGRVRAIALAPDGVWVVAADDYRNVLRWDVNVPSAPVSLHTGGRSGRARGVRSLAVTRDGETVVVGADDGTVWATPASGSRGVRRLGRHRRGARVRSVAVSPDGIVVASVAEDATLRFWRLAAADDAGTLAQLSLASLPSSVVAVGGGFVIGDQTGGVTMVDLVGDEPEPLDDAGDGGASEVPPLMVVVDQSWLRHFRGLQETDVELVASQAAEGRQHRAVVAVRVPGRSHLRDVRSDRVGARPAPRGR